MYTEKKLANVTRVSVDNLVKLLNLDREGKFYLQETGNEYFSVDNFTELETTGYNLRNHLDNGETIIFITNEALSGSSLEDIIFNENVEEYYKMCDALENAFKEGVMEKEEGQLIFGRNNASEEIIIYDYNDISGDVQDVASSLFEDLFYGSDAARLETIHDMLDRMIDKTDDRFESFLSDLRNVAEIREGVFKEELLSY